MQISYLGLNCFKIQTKNNLIVTDPYGDKSGLTLPRFKAEIVTISNQNNENANNLKPILSPQLVIEHPGEYEKSGSFIYGISTNGNGNNIYLIEDEGIFIAHLGFLEKELEESELKQLKNVDILLLPITGLSPKALSKLVSILEPRIIIPMFYKSPKLKLKADDLSSFTKTLGIKDKEHINKLKISKKDLPQDETQIIFLDIEK